MSDRDEILPDIDEVRSEIQSMGFRRYSVTVRRRVWSGTRVGDGVATNTDRVLTPAPKVRQLTAQQVASSGGTYEQGDYLIDKITPQYTTPTAGGNTPAQLELTTTAENEDLVVVLVGDDGTHVCTVVKTKFDRPFSYSMVVRPRRETP